MLDYLILLLGLAGLVVAGDFLVRGAVGLAERFGIPPLIIGLTIVALGTSAPELVVSIQAAFDGVADIAVGNVVGSNIANVLLVLGVPALIAAIPCDQQGLKRSTFFMLGVSVLFIALAFSGTLVLWHGAVLLAALVVFLYGSYRTAVATGDTGDAELETIDGVEGVPHSLWAALGFLAIGVIGLPFAADATVDSATAIARTLGVPEVVIGLTIIAIGTSLPELVTTVVAALKGQSDVGVGNVIGSNIFNILFILGTTAVITPIPIAEQIVRFDIWVMLGASLLLLPFILAKRSIGRVAGIGFLVAYALYLGVLVAHALH
ncbi:MAG: calcium/sodium antiporter [Devosiaceae bacterium]|nr:calcium/sodium antiporter [Devosiaceae bacterium MH13]